MVWNRGYWWQLFVDVVRPSHLVLTNVGKLIFQATARWRNAYGVGNAPLYIHPLFTGLALPEHNAHFSVPLWSSIRSCTFTASFSHRFQSALCAALSALHSEDVQVLHSHRRHISQATCKAIRRHSLCRKSLLAKWPSLLQGHFPVVRQPPGPCRVAHLHGVQLILRQHLPDVLPCSTTGMGSEGTTLVGMFPLCEDSETKSSVGGRSCSSIGLRILTCGTSKHVPRWLAKASRRFIFVSPIGECQCKW